MRATMATLAVLFCLIGPAGAGDHPYAGVWGEAAADDARENPDLAGETGCYNKFFEQQPDGRFQYYLVDHAKWLAERKIEYLLAQEGTCTMDGGGKTEKCVGRFIGEKESEWYLAYRGQDATRVQATYYENVFYFEKRFNGEPIERVRCPFDRAKIAPFISGKTTAECATRCRAFGTSEAAAFHDMVKALGAQK